MTKVLEYMTPKSQFDADCYESYANYYANKYNLDILGSESQPLLEVCHACYLIKNVINK